jgi:hypothetical protein
MRLMMKSRTPSALVMPMGGQGWTAERVAIVKRYQRRTQKGMGRTEKTVHNGAAKNPRLFKACNITRKRDMGEFFFISMSDEICDKIPLLTGAGGSLLKRRRKVAHFFESEGIKL